jgi:hypothetical protein
MNIHELSKDEKVSHHHKAAEHLELAAKHHREAATHVKSESCEKAATETLKAVGHVLHAKHHTKTVIKAHVCKKKD